MWNSEKNTTKLVLKKFRPKIDFETKKTVLKYYCSRSTSYEKFKKVVFPRSVILLSILRMMNLKSRVVQVAFSPSSKQKENVRYTVPENIHTPPTEKGLEFPGGGGSMRQKKLKKCMKLNWNFQRSREVLGKNSLLWGRCGYFLELHNKKW